MLARKLSGSASGSCEVFDSAVLAAFCALAIAVVVPFLIVMLSAAIIPDMDDRADLNAERFERGTGWAFEAVKAVGVLLAHAAPPDFGR